MIALGKYTDWYYVYSNGSTEYIDTTFDGYTYVEICNGNGGYDGGYNGSGETGGGGGSSTYSDYTNGALTETEAQTYKDQMSASEVTLYNGLSAYQQTMYLLSAHQAFQKSQELYNEPCELHNGQGDAFRHAYWNALSTFRIGEELTLQLTTAHEDKPPSYAYNDFETDMDLHNNSVGIDIISKLSAGQIVYEAVVTELENGRLVYLNNLLGPEQGCQATAQTQFISTNGN